MKSWEACQQNYFHCSSSGLSSTVLLYLLLWNVIIIGREDAKRITSLNKSFAVRHNRITQFKWWEMRSQTHTFDTWFRRLPGRLHLWWDDFLSCRGVLWLNWNEGWTEWSVALLDPCALEYKHFFLLPCVRLACSTLSWKSRLCTLQGDTWNTLQSIHKFNSTYNNSKLTAVQDYDMRKKIKNYLENHFPQNWHALWGVCVLWRFVLGSPSTSTMI